MSVEHFGNHDYVDKSLTPMQIATTLFCRWIHFNKQDPMIYINDLYLTPWDQA